MIARSCSLLCCGLALALACAPLRARAQVSADGTAALADTRAVRRVSVRLPDCEGAPWTRAHAAELLHALELELQSDGIAELRTRTTREDAGRDEAQLELLGECNGSADRFTLRARVAPSEPVHARTLDLRDVPSALRPRALSLALAELLRASMASTPAPRESTTAAVASPQPSDARVQPAPPADASTALERVDEKEDEADADDEPEAAAPEEKPVAPGEPRAEPDAEATRATAPPAEREAATDDSEPARHALWIAGDLRWRPNDGGVLYGGALGWQWPPLGASLHALFGRSSDPLGSAHFGLVHAVLSYEPLQLSWARERLHGGPAFGVGGTWASAGSSDTADGGSALMLSYQLGLQLGLAHALSPDLGADLVLAGGYARGPEIRADQRELASLSGAFLSAALRLTLGVGAR